MATAIRIETDSVLITHPLFIGGRWRQGGEPFDITNKYSGRTIASVSRSRPEDVEAAIAAARRAVPAMSALPAHRRAEILQFVAEGIDARREEMAHTIAAESGKALKYARLEVARGIGTFVIAAEEAKRIHGETVPMDAVTAGEGYVGYWTRRPVGVVAAITPFNFPLNLVAHKVAPAIAAGNAVILKPSELTPLTAVILCEIFAESGLPDGGLNLVQGMGAATGAMLVSDPRVDAVSFTGSRAVGERIVRAAGIKKVTLELGNTSPVVIAEDADVDFAATRCATAAFYNAGQVCVSVQRIYANSAVYEQFVDRFVAAADTLLVGDPMDERVDVGPLIREEEADRIESWVAEACDGGAQIRSGGRREGATYWPTVLTNVTDEMRIMRDEVFAPVASVVSCPTLDEALRRADACEYGLQASVFTSDINTAFRAVRELNFGGVVVNDTPAFRTEHMPYGGNRQSGLGREGVRFAIEDVTNVQMVSIRTGR